MSAAGPLFIPAWPSLVRQMRVSSLFFCKVSANTELYTLSLHDALPISSFNWKRHLSAAQLASFQQELGAMGYKFRSEEHTSELQSHSDLVCRLLLEKKKLQNSLTLAKNPAVSECMPSSTSLSNLRDSSF